MRFEADILLVGLEPENSGCRVFPGALGWLPSEYMNLTRRASFHGPSRALGTSLSLQMLAIIFMLTQYLKNTHGLNL